MPGGNDLDRLAKTSSILPVSLTESAPGCFWTLTITAGLLSNPASPRLNDAAGDFGQLLEQDRLALGIAHRDVLQGLPGGSSAPGYRIRYSHGHSVRGNRHWCCWKTRCAVSRSSNPTPSWPIIAVLGSIRELTDLAADRDDLCYPGIDNRRGRRMKSAYSRTAIGLTLAGSAGKAISMISPITDEIGPMFGLTPAGSCSFTFGQSFGDQLSISVDIRSPGELGIDDR